jgi:hypothetical protein
MTAQWWWAEEWEATRRGSVPLEIEFDGGAARGVLFDVGTPVAVAALRERLPLRMPVIHVAWSGDMVMGTERLPLDVPGQEDYTRLPRPGDLGYDPKFGELTLTYGTAECRLPSGSNTIAVVGQVTEDLGALADFCRRRRFEGVGEICLRERPSLSP